MQVNYASCPARRHYSHFFHRKNTYGPIAAKAISVIAKELETTMGLCGVNTIAEIDDHVLAV